MEVGKNTSTAVCNGTVCQPEKMRGASGGNGPPCYIRKITNVVPPGLPLNEHRDVCPAMLKIGLFRLALQYKKD
jgi:hypothetical protein